MREMNIAELESVAGGITWDGDTCEGTFVVGGTILGAVGGSFFGGIGGWAGAAAGGTAGGFAGELFCPILTQ